MLFVGFGWLFWFEVAVLGRDTPPAPLERGGLRCWVLFGNWYSAYNHFFLYFVVVIGFCGGRPGQKRGGCLWNLV